MEEEEDKFDTQGVKLMWLKCDTLPYLYLESSHGPQLSHVST